MTPISDETHRLGYIDTSRTNRSGNSHNDHTRPGYHVLHKAEGVRSETEGHVLRGETTKRQLRSKIG